MEIRVRNVISTASFESKVSMYFNFLVLVIEILNNFLGQKLKLFTLYTKVVY